MENPTQSKKVRKNIEFPEHLVRWVDEEFGGTSMNVICNLLVQKLKDVYESSETMILEPPTPKHMAEKVATEVKEELEGGLLKSEE